MVACWVSPRARRARPRSNRASTPSRPRRAESARATTSAASPAAGRTSPRASSSRASCARTGQPDRPRQRLADDLGWGPTTGRGHAAASRPAAPPCPRRARAPRARRPGCPPPPRPRGPARARSSPGWCAARGRSSARPGCHGPASPRQPRWPPRRSGPARCRCRRGCGWPAGGWSRPGRGRWRAGPRSRRVRRSPGVEVHLGADRGGLGQLLLGAGRGGGVLVGPVEQPEPLVGPAHLRGGDAGSPGDLGADRRRTVTGREGALEDLDGVAGAHRGVERGEDPVGHRVAGGAGGRVRHRR